MSGIAAALRKWCGGGEKRALHCAACVTRARGRTEGVRPYLSRPSPNTAASLPPDLLRGRRVAECAPLPPAAPAAPALAAAAVVCVDLVGRPGPPSGEEDEDGTWKGSEKPAGERAWMTLGATLSRRAGDAPARDRESWLRRLERAGGVVSRRARDAPAARAGRSGAPTGAWCSGGSTVRI